MPLTSDQLAAINARSENNNLSPDGGIPDNTTPSPAPSKETQIQDAPKVEEGKETPTPTDDKGEIDFSQFIDKKAIVEPEPVKKSDEVTPTPVSTTPPAAQPKPGARDFSDLEDDVKPLFERMSNEAFSKLKPVYLEHRKQQATLAAKEKEIQDLKKGRIPDSYFEHERGYTLTPEFEQAVYNANLAQAVYQHWIQQLQEAEEGAEKFKVIDFDQKQQRFVVTQEVPVTAASKIQLQSYVNWAQNQLMGKKAEMDALATVHKERFIRSNEELAEQQKKFFSAFDDPKNKPIYDPVIQGFLEEAVPQTYRNSALAIPYARALTLIKVLGTQLMQAKKLIGGNGAAAPNNPRAVQPSAGEIAGEGGSGKGKTEVSMEDFNRIKEGY